MFFSLNTISQGVSPRSLCPARAIIVLLVLASLLSSCSKSDESRGFFSGIYTIAGKNREFGEPFGIAERGGEVFVSDGENGRILRIDKVGSVTEFAGGLDTPSGITFDADGNLLIADSGSHLIKRIDRSGNVSTVAGRGGSPGFADGPALEALFMAPIGIAADTEGRIFVSDTYNDRIRVIENGSVRTIAGGPRGFADGPAYDARFDSPLGLALLDGKRLLVADSGNHRIRVIEHDGRVWTLAGNGENVFLDGQPGDASFSSPTALAVSKTGVIFIADGSAIRVIGRRFFPFVETISGKRSGLLDGDVRMARFNRPSGLTIGGDGDLLVADSDNQVIRVFTRSSDYSPITETEIGRMRPEPFEFRANQPGRWPFDPPDRTREIAGTLGEIRGEIQDESSQAWFHNGLDIPGGYGETARFIRAEKVLKPAAVENFGTLRELLRMPTIGYTHIRLGRGPDDNPLGDSRFLFEYENGRPVYVRIPRGTRFSAGDSIGTLNAMNHVHLVAGRPGAEFNALDALTLPGIADGIAPIIESVRFYTEDWREIETESPLGRIKIIAKTRIVVRAYDRANGNAERRRLAPYRIGYEVFSSGEPPTEPRQWSISFEKMPPDEAVRFVYAPGSRSGATGETIFNFVATNHVRARGFEEGFFDPAKFDAGFYTIRVFASDFFGNITAKDIFVEVVK